ncbi:MAG TPA: response regulator transcription factor [Firmicutes bacterium]|jgi:two-component system response regulator DevR|nr:response regulator transcription factor [Bacillota bacterium]
MKRIRILIVDDHEVVRAGLCSILRQVPDFDVVAHTESGEVALAIVTEKLPDVVLLDVRLPNMSGIDVCRAVRSQYPSVRVIMLTSYSDDEALMASLLAGANGYVLKEIDCRRLISAIRTVAAGGSLLDPDVSERVMQRLRDQVNVVSDAEEVALSEREQRILGLIAEGKTNKEIAVVLKLSEKTVRNYVSSLLAKLKVNNRAEAAAQAIRDNLVL